MSRVVLDAGAYVAYEKGATTLRAHIAVGRRLGHELVTTSPVVAQVWRSPRQAMTSKLLAATRVDAPTEAVARRAGELLAKTKTKDVVDALVVLLARDADIIITSDARDLRPLLEACGTKATLLDV
jgi:hypothetical protein